MLLNGTYNNQILNNQSWANTGADLAWAQAVPNASTPIGVTTYQGKRLYCNVTASEGGGGVANLNGNVWKGNTYQKSTRVTTASRSCEAVSDTMLNLKRCPTLISDCI